MNAIYLDSSALVKLVIAEPESSALRRFLRGHEVRVTCALARAEVPRAVAPHGEVAVRRARSVLERLDVIRIDDALLDSAASLGPGVLRTLDAIHIAAASSLQGSLEVLVTYDRRMEEAALALGLAIRAPGRR